MNALKLQIPEEGEFVTFKNYEKKITIYDL